ncbi:MAG: hypothetical protein ABSF17_18495 [Terracidiphilus sp.]
MKVTHRSHLLAVACFCAIPFLLLATGPAACHKEEQAVVGVAHNAVQAAQHAQSTAQANASQRDQQRTELAKIPLPTKSLYVDVHEPSMWSNPFLSVGATTLNLRITLADANPSPVGQGTLLRPEAARRQELQIRPADLADAVVALPPGAWRYGRVIAVAESPLAVRKDRSAVRRNVEAAINQLNDLGIVVEEWPAR